MPPASTAHLNSARPNREHRRNQGQTHRENTQARPGNEADMIKPNPPLASAVCQDERGGRHCRQQRDDRPHVKIPVFRQPIEHDRQMRIGRRYYKGWLYRGWTSVIIRLCTLAMANIEPASPLSASPAQRPLLGILLRLAAMAVLGVMFSLVKLAGQHGVHVTESLFYRQLAGLPVAIIWLWWTGALASIRTARPMQHAVRMLLGVSAMALNFSAMLLLPMAEATTLGFAAQIFATMLAAFLLREPTGRYRWGAVALGFVGVVIALQPGGQPLPLTGAMVALGGALMTGCVIIQLRRMAQTEPAGAIVFWFSLTSLVPLGVAVAIFGKNHDLTSWSIIAGLSLAGAIAQILLTASLRHASVAAIMTMDYSALLWSAMIGFAVFGDLPGHSVWLGAPLIVGAGLIIAWREQFLARRRAMEAAEYPAG